jgi:hypothetical protein
MGTAPLHSDARQCVTQHRVVRTHPPRYRRAIRDEASMHGAREFAGHAYILTTEVYFVRKEEDAEVAARRIQIRITGRKGE